MGFDRDETAPCPSYVMQKPYSEQNETDESLENKDCSSRMTVPTTYAMPYGSVYGCIHTSVTRDLSRRIASVDLNKVRENASLLFWQMGTAATLTLLLCIFDSTINRRLSGIAYAIISLVCAGFAVSLFRQKNSHMRQGAPSVKFERTVHSLNLFSVCLVVTAAFRFIVAIIDGYYMQDVTASLSINCGELCVAHHHAVVITDMVLSALNLPFWIWVMHVVATLRYVIRRINMQRSIVTIRVQPAQAPNNDVEAQVYGTTNDETDTAPGTPKKNSTNKSVD